MICFALGMVMWLGMGLSDPRIRSFLPSPPPPRVGPPPAEDLLPPWHGDVAGVVSSRPPHPQLPAEPAPPFAGRAKLRRTVPLSMTARLGREVDAVAVAGIYPRRPPQLRG